MAEAAGLVIGGVGLLSLFDSCMNAFEYVDSGRQYGKDYQRTAFQISLLQLRLSRWKQSVYIREDITGISNQVQVATPEEVETVKELLGNIEYDFQTAQTSSKRYTLKGPPPPENGTEAATIDALSARVRKLAISRQKNSSLGQKTKWALHDKKKFSNLITELEGNVTSLVQLFPTTMVRQGELAVADVTEVIEPAGIEEPEEAVQILRETSSGIDDQLVNAIETIAARKTAGYSFKKMGLNGYAKAQYGTHYADGQYVRDHRVNMNFEDVVAHGNAKAHYGDRIGGKNVLDDEPGDFHRQVHGSGDATAGAQSGGRQMQGYGRGGYAGYQGNRRS